MANRHESFGIAKDEEEKTRAKYSEDTENEVVAWISCITGESPNGSGFDAFHDWLKDGHVLCKLMNIIQPGSCTKVNNTASCTNPGMRKNKEMNNIGIFLSAIGKYGVPAEDQFQTVDLYEAQNLPAVQNTMYQLSSVAMRKGYDGPAIGVKLADQNVRELDEQKLREGRNVIGLQMGTNQVASQKGMTPYGLGRQLTPQTD